MFLKNVIKKSVVSCLKEAKYLFSTSNVIYLDYQATTPIDYRVMDAMTPYMIQYYGNPHSKTHQFGWDTSKGVEIAREQIAALIEADPK
jgi:cysteine desulfurase